MYYLKVLKPEVLFKPKQNVKHFYYLWIFFHLARTKFVFWDFENFSMLNKFLFCLKDFNGSFWIILKNPIEFRCSHCTILLFSLLIGRFFHDLSLITVFIWVHTFQWFLSHFAKDTLGDDWRRKKALNMCCKRAWKLREPSSEATTEFESLVNV